MNNSELTPDVATAVRWRLLALAKQEEDRAATEAAAVPYWSHHPTSIEGHRAAAAALRESADRLLNLTRLDL